MSEITAPVQVILADDHALVRAGVRALLEKMPQLTVAAEAGDGREVIDLARQHGPDIVVMDIAMPGLNGLEAAEQLAHEMPRVRVVILSMHQTEEYVYRALKAGVAGYLLKKAATTELDVAIQTVLRGEVYLCREIATRLPQAFRLEGAAALKMPFEQLSARQREILQLIAEGQNTKQIAERLNLSPKTVEYHRTKLMSVLKLHDVPALVRFAMRMGLVQPDN